MPWDWLYGHRALIPLFCVAAALVVVALVCHVLSFFVKESKDTMAGGFKYKREDFKDVAGEWRWHVRHRNGRIVATSGGDGYKRKMAMRASYNHFCAAVRRGEIELPGLGDRVWLAFLEIVASVLKMIQGADKRKREP